MAIKVFLFVMCSISTAIAGEYRLHELPLISLQHFHEDHSGGHDPGGEHIDESSSLAQEYIGDGHSGNHDVHDDVIEHGSPVFVHDLGESDHPTHEFNSEFLHSSHVGDSGDLDGHSEVHTGTSYVSIKGHDGKKLEYIVDHSSDGSSSTSDHSGGGIGHESYGLETYAAGQDYVSVNQHPLKSESFIILNQSEGEGSGQAESQHYIYDDSSSSPHTHTQDFGGHEAVSTSSFKDHNKGTSYSVKQTHGHKGLASVTTKSHEHSHETEQIHGDYSGHGNHIQPTQHDENLIQHSAEFHPH